ncbi:acetyl-CoA acetyltransferase [Paenibacillus baekrokdamisoli]|uniref:acetyl-CoA C-acetyltransferase n=1 Tax=Paenibacillus baekrokdamisoli TaxID=1712516 RepID=A0A3G9J1I7_9BACL|nr:acetyl-CoA C-acetyltransferase [Paenibacillus baekrokdamisoli]MBB3070827.1 acetyl-CoA C-acetyltransferase [Paenibacillus baekrokdamisoli]BBH22235.1 acetyl-CoA acetyltransferase [Paenibacillus baekrokdamisoli]
MTEVVIVGGARTAFGKFGGALQEKTAAELGGIAISGALMKAKVNPAEVDEVTMGMALQAGAGQNPARQAAHLGGLGWQVPAVTVNKVCASGMRSLTMAVQVIRAGDAGLIIAGGMESMSHVPYALSGDTRWGLRMGDSKVTDLLLRDGLHCAFDQMHMGDYANEMAAEYSVSRLAQDEWALRSQTRAIQATQQGVFRDEITPVTVTGGKGSLFVIDTDEAPRADTNASKLASLRPVFKSGGTITAGNSPGLNDGAAALVVMSRERANQSNYVPQATILSHASVNVEPRKFPITPALVVQKLLRTNGIALPAIDLLEINEAFAAVVLVSGSITLWDAEKVNVHGGAIALGHPIGASGARIVLTLIHALRRRGGGLGIAAICSGGGQGDAVLIRVDE